MWGKTRSQNFSIYVTILRIRHIKLHNCKQMLKLTLIIISILILPLITKRYWWVRICTLILIIPFSISWLLVSNRLRSISQFSIIDNLSSTLIILRIIVARLMYLARSKVFASPNNILFSSLNIILLLILLNCFSSASILSFYIWFEASLIPTLLIIITWGYQPERIQASIYLIIYTITASLPIFIIFCEIYSSSFHNLISMSSELIFPSDLSITSGFWLLALAGFLVKLPIFSVHLWLPKAHVEAPIAGSIVLAAILLKLGGYGLLRIITIFPKMHIHIASPLMRVALCGGVATSLICIRQPDLKSLIAYSSVGHIGLILAGIMSNSSWGIVGSLAIIIAHGLRSSALFVLANISYEITHTRSIFLTKGLICVRPIITIWWFLFTGANIAAPPSINLLREIILISSILSFSLASILLVSLIRFFTAAYSLHIFSTTQHGQIRTFSNPLLSIKSKDINLLLIHLVPIVALIIKPELITNWL